MTLTHGNTKSAVQSRITERAFAIAQRGFTDEELRDSTDINHNEEKEIEFAHQLAEAWGRGEAIEVWHLKGVSTLYSDK